MTFKRPRRAGHAAVVELTPLIDVVFLLLIFFMASTTFLRESQIAIELPQAARAPASSAAHVEVRVDAAGRYAINGRLLPDGELKTLLDALAAQATGGQAVVVAADARTPHQAVVRVLDAAGRSGLTNVRIATVPPPGIESPEQADG